MEWSEETIVSLRALWTEGTFHCRDWPPVGESRRTRWWARRTGSICRRQPSPIPPRWSQHGATTAFRAPHGWINAAAAVQRSASRGTLAHHGGATAQAVAEGCRRRAMRPAATATLWPSGERTAVGRSGQNLAPHGNFTSATPSRFPVSHNCNEHAQLAYVRVRDRREGRTTLKDPRPDRRPDRRPDPPCNLPQGLMTPTCMILMCALMRGRTDSPPSPCPLVANAIDRTGLDERG